MREFNEALVEAVEETISELMSSRVAQQVLAVLKTDFSVDRHEIPYRLDTVLSMLESKFGAGPGRTISRLIVRRLYEKLGLRLTEEEGLSILDYVEQAKRELASKT